MQRVFPPAGTDVSGCRRQRGALPMALLLAAVCAAPPALAHNVGENARSWATTSTTACTPSRSVGR